MAIKKIIAFGSAKGGVGKSSVSTQTALGLLEKGLTVGLLDVDLCGPSIPRMIGIEGEEVQRNFHDEKEQTDDDGSGNEVYPEGL